MPVSASPVELPTSDSDFDDYDDDALGQVGELATESVYREMPDA